MLYILKIKWGLVGKPFHINPHFYKLICVFLDLCIFLFWKRSENDCISSCVYFIRDVPFKIVGDSFWSKSIRRRGSEKWLIGGRSRNNSQKGSLKVGSDLKHPCPLIQLQVEQPLGYWSYSISITFNGVVNMSNSKQMQCHNYYWIHLLNKNNQLTQSRSQNNLTEIVDLMICS